MDHDVIESEIIETEAGIFRVEYRPDHDAMSPREWDNLGTLVLSHEWVGDFDETATRRDRRALRTPGMSYAHGVITDVTERLNRGDAVSLRAALRYLRLSLADHPDLRTWTVVPLAVGFDKYTPSVSALDETDEGPMVDGFLFDTAERRRVMGPESPEQAARWLREEAQALSRWTEGEYVWYSVERLHVDEWDEERPDVDDVEADPDAYAWVVVDSLCSIDDLSYAQDEARGTVRAYTPDDFPSRNARRALAAQV